VSVEPCHVKGRVSPKSNVKLISFMPALHTGPAKHIWHMENRKVGELTFRVRMRGLNLCVSRRGLAHFGHPEK